MTNWKRVSGGFGGTNYVLEGDGFYISFNEDLSAGIFGVFGDSDDGGPETALVDERDGDRTFHILNGDFRATYERLVPDGWDACKRFYDQQSAHADSSWSDRDAAMTLATTPS